MLEDLFMIIFGFVVLAIIAMTVMFFMLGLAWGIGFFWEGLF